MATRDEFVEGINERLEDVELYELAAKEIEQGGVVQGLWVKALAEAKNNQEEAKALYPKLRAQMFRDQRDVKTLEEEYRQDARRRYAEEEVWTRMKNRVGRFVTLIETILSKFFWLIKWLGILVVLFFAGGITYDQWDNPNLSLGEHWWATVGAIAGAAVLIVIWWFFFRLFRGAKDST